MKLAKQLIDELMVRPGKPAHLKHRSTSRTEADWLEPIGRTTPKEVAEHDLEVFKSELESAQELLYASAKWAILFVLQALDAAGKDGTIKHVMSGVNPQGCQVHSFKQPSSEELLHDFLWRCAKELPERGHIGIFNRSYYEEVLVLRIHPELIAGELPGRSVTPSDIWQQRFEDINAFERHVHRSGTRVVKVFLHLSKEEQRKRFLERLDDPAKHWKFSLADVSERAHFDEYQQAYEEALTATSTEWAPWYIVPADHKAAMRALVGGILVHEIGRLDLRMPEPDPERARALDAARATLMSEPS